MTITAGRDSKQWEAPNPDFERTVHEAFKAQPAMALIGAHLERVEPGFVEIHLPIRDEIMSHIPGIVHGGTLGMIADSAMGFVGLTLAEPGAAGVTAEYKLNLLAPATGEKVIARGYMVKPGKKSGVTRADLYAVNDGKEKFVATGLATLMAI